MTSDLLDINLWLALEVSTDVHHGLAKAWFRTRGQTTCALCRVTQMGLLRHLTNKTVMGANVLSIVQAWAAMTRTRSRGDVEWRDEPAGLDAKWEALSQLGGSTGNWWTDAYLAAFAIKHSIRFVTLDAGFRRFEPEGLNLHVLQPVPQPAP